MKIVRVDVEVGEPAAKPRTVLVLVDDVDWRDVVRRVLEQEGYVVLIARHAGHALLTCARHEGAIDLLISDEVTPDGRGRTIAKTLRAEQPGMRALLFGRRPAERDSLVAAVRSALT
jgi:DNA-binding NtrC family response regulator